MKNFCLFLICLIIFPMLYFSSCAKEENNNDGVKPKISEVMFNSNDTIMWKGTAIRINHPATKEEMDTLVIGKLAYMSGRFTSNKEKALSGYKVEFYFKMKNKDTGEVIDDTLRAVGTTIYGKNDTIVKRNNLVLIPDTTSISIVVDGKTEKGMYYPVEGEYKINIVCGDIYGNRDSIQHDVRLLSRRSIYDSRNK